MASTNWEALCDKQSDTIDSLQTKIDCYEETIKTLNQKINNIHRENVELRIRSNTVEDILIKMIKEIKENG